MRFGAAALIGLVLAVAGLLSLAAGPPSRASRSAHSRQGWAALPIAARLAVARGIGADARVFWVSPRHGLLTARSPRQRLVLGFTGAGASVSAAGGRLGLGLRAIGRGSVLHTLAAVSPAATHNRVTYRRRGVTEWYANGPLGLEQGFTLSARPTGQIQGPVTLALALTGRLRPVLDGGGQALSLTGAGRRAVMRYQGLSVSDARGRALRSWLELRGRRLLIRVDDGRARYPLIVDPFVQAGKLTAPDGAAGYNVGQSVAISGDTVVVGAPGATVPGGQGAVYVFVKPAAGWGFATQTAKLSASDSETVGDSVAISGDTIVAGAESAGSNTQGAVYVFVKPSSGPWANATQTAKLTASDGTTSAGLGNAVGISGDTIVAGAPGVTSTPSCGPTNAGAAYVFVKPSSGAWANATQTAKLTASDPATGDRLGCSVAISGPTVVAGAPGARIGANGQQGAAYVFVRPSSGWRSGTQTQHESAKLTASDGSAGDGLGSALAVDGATIVAGVGSASVGTNSGQGAVYVFAEPAVGWGAAMSPQHEAAKLTASDGNGGDGLGASVGISAGAVVAGAPFADVTNLGQGTAYVFDEPSSGWSSWHETAKLVASDGAANDGFGTAVAVDGGTVVAGAPAAMVNGNIAQGAAYVSSVPVIATMPVTSVSQTQATLNGSVNPGGNQVTDCHFEWGTTIGYGQSAPCSPPPASGSSAVQVSAPLAGLTPNTTYHFRVVVSNASVTGIGADGADQSFTTLPGPPSAVTGQPSAVSETDATLNGTVNPGGGTVSDCHFDWGSTSAYGNSAPCAQSQVSGSSNAAVSAGLSNLAANTTYHFRVVAVNAAGTSDGADQSFTTLSTPPTVATGRPSAVTQAEATFNGAVNPGGLGTTAHFEYGLDARYRLDGGAIVYDQSTPAQQLGPDTISHHVSASVSGLFPNALYHVRLVASNQQGTEVGQDQTFVTLSDPAPPRPVLGKRENALPGGRLVLIKLKPGQSLYPHKLAKGQGFVPLTEERPLPPGAQVDLRFGMVRLLAAAARVQHIGKLQSGEFAGGLFRLTQARTGIQKGLTTLQLLDDVPGAPASSTCTAHGAADGPAARPAISHRVLQTLRSRVHGRFRTRGRYSAGTVRGTIWDTIDRCDGTLTIVHRGTVDVSDFRLRKTIPVHAGQTYLARAS